jgi:hypothetical protein
MNSLTLARRAPLLLGLVMLVSARLPRIDPQSTTGPRAEAARISRDVAWLADEAREGRRAGTAKALEVADFLAKRYETLGLSPGGDHGFLQEFDVPLEPRTGGGSFAADESRHARVDEGSDLVPLFCSEGRDVSAPVVFVGFGIEDDERGWNDYGGRRIDGRIALVVRGVPKQLPKPKSEIAATNGGWGGDGLIFTKVMTAKRRGAIGVVLLQNPGEEDKPLLAFGEGGSARAAIPCAMISIPGAKRIFAQAVTAWIAGLEAGPVAMFPDGTTVALHSDVIRERGPARNVLALMRGIDSARCIVVGAHYDHLGRGGEGSLAPGERGQIHHGADDNASGTAAILEIARLLSIGPRPACDVLFTSWSGEELGLLGSEFWANHPTRPLDSIAANLNLDMVGRAGKSSGGKLQVLGAGTAEPFASWMDEAGKNAGLDLVVSASGSALGGSSDHATFLKRRIPVLHLFSGLHADYHKPSDTADKVEADGCAKAADLGVDLVRRLCAAEKLAFVEPKVDPKAKTEMKTAYRAWFGSIPNYAWDKEGVLIDGTSPGSPAEHAGFLKGDVLKQIGDIKLARIDDFQFALQTYKPGDVVVVKFVRDGKDQETRVTLSTRGQQ